VARENARIMLKKFVNTYKVKQSGEAVCVKNMRKSSVLTMGMRLSFGLDLITF
jgi:hypothetical protein